MKVLIPDSIPLSFSHHSTDIEFHLYSVTSTDFSAVQDAELLVLWANSAENCRAAVSQLKNLKAVQSLAAGPDHVLSLGFDERITISSGRGLHDRPVAEHGLALVLATIRNIDGLTKSQQRSYWDHEMVSAQANAETAALYTLDGASVAIIGFGSIAAHLAPQLEALGAKVSGVAQSSGERNGYPVVEMSAMGSIISGADVVISLLPHTPETEKTFNSAFFESMKPTSIFINLGRGKTVDETALHDALTKGVIRKAAIDVTYVEPLPENSPLWTTPNLIITPHISGGRPQNAEILILQNAELLLSGKELINHIAR